MPMVYDRSCLRLDDLFPVVSRSLHLGIEKKACQYRGVGLKLLCTPFAQVIAGWYEKGATHPSRCVCDLCNRSFSTQGCLKRHRESVHRQSAGFSCQVYSKHFYRKDHLAKHMKMHQKAELLAHSAACSMDATVDLAPTPPPSLLPRATARGSCATFAPRCSLPRKR